MKKLIIKIITFAVLLGLLNTLKVNDQYAMDSSKTSAYYFLSVSR